jgi:hypothetical protein
MFRPSAPPRRRSDVDMPRSIDRLRPNPDISLFRAASAARFDLGLADLRTAWEDSR